MTVDPASLLASTWFPGVPVARYGDPGAPYDVEHLRIVAFEVLMAPTPTSTVVTAEEALSGRHGPTLVRYRLEERTYRNLLVRDMSEALIGGSVDLDNERPIVRTARLQLRGDLLPAGFDADANAVAVWMDVWREGAWDAYQLGLFVLDRPVVSRDSSYPAEVWDVQAADVSALVWRAHLSDVRRLRAGDPYAPEIAAIIGGVGLRTDIPSSGVSVTSDQVWGPGTPLGQPMQELAEGLNWHVPWATTEGVMTTRPRINPADETPAVGYTTLFEPRMIFDVRGASERVETVRTQGPNRIAVVVDDPLRAGGGFYALRVNEDPASLVSTVVIGQEITEEEQLPRTASLAIADQIADYLLRVADARSRSTTLQTLTDPRREAHEFYRVTFESAEVNQLYMVAGWSLTLAPGAPMTHRLRRVQDITTRSLL